MTTPTPPPGLSEGQLTELRREVALDGPSAWDLPGIREQLLASARRCAELEAFLAEHGEAVEGGLRGIYDEFELRDELEAFRKLRGTR